MRRLALVAAASVFAALVMVTAAVPAEPEASIARYCGKADIGFTTAKVRARNVGCAKARRFVRRASQRKLNCSEANGFCRVTRFKGFRCVISGMSIVKVRCQRGRQVISETHGD